MSEKRSLVSCNEFWISGLLGEAIDEHQEELQYCESLSDQIGVAVANRKIGECYFDSHEYTKAIKYMTNHLDIAQQQKSAIETQRAHATIGKYYK